jgi:hypothetical protein
VTVAVVTGTTREVGKGDRARARRDGRDRLRHRASTVDEAAAEVTARGGHGIGGQVDLVAANAWGGYENDGWRAFSQRSASSR